jgi:outer membrane receptor protein involved in Fe transport
MNETLGVLVKMFRLRIPALLLLLTLMFGTSFAQTSKGILSGVVRDSSGAVLVDVSVLLTNLDTGETRTVNTNGIGTYRADAIAPGRYSVQVEAAGFEKFSAQNVNVSPSVVTSYDPILKPGRASETVSIDADVVQLNTENGSLGTTLGGTELANLPIFTLNPIELVTTLPGAQIVSNSGMSNGANIQVSGARARANNFLIDGQEINDSSIGGQALAPEIPDIYQDVVAYTHDAPAEFGRASGGVVNLITKSGTNTFHGSAWELYSGSGLNAKDGQLRQTDTAKTRYDQHQYGFTAGGPVIKNKLFAFGAAQWSRYYGQEQASPINLPDAAGIALLQTIAAGGNATTAANAALLLQYLSNATYLNTFTEFDPATFGTSKALGAACPANQAGCQLTITQFLRPSVAENNPDTQWTYKIDFTPSTKDTFTARYIHDRSVLTPDFFNNGTALPGFDTYQGGPGEVGQGSWTHIFSTHLLNEFRASETRISFLFAPTAESVANPLYNSPNMSIGGLVGLGFPKSSFPQGRSQDQYQFQDTLSWTAGKQTLRAGADIGRRIEEDVVPLNTNGTLTFADGGSGIKSAGNFLLNQLGPSGTATATFGRTRIDPHSWRSGIFAQDDIKLTPDFTVNLGIRYDYFTSPENSLQYPAIDPNNPYAAVNTVYKVSADKNNVAPRIGFAYSPASLFGDQSRKTVIRGGFGIFYDSDFTNIAYNEAQSSPNAVGGTLTSTQGNGLGNATGLISQISPVLSPQASVLSVTKNLVSPYSIEWNFGFERELPGDIKLSAMYVGNRGVKLFANQQYNYFSFDTGDRLDPDRGAINARGNIAASMYHGVEVEGEHQFKHGIQVRGTYTYSKNLDDGSEVFTPDSAQTSYTANLAPGGRSQDWSNSAYDHRHFASFEYVWAPSGLHSSSRGADLLLGALTRHWTIAGIEQFQSGAYSTVNFYGIDSNGDGNIANDRPILVNSKAPFSSVGIDAIYVDQNTPGSYYDLATLNGTTGAEVPVDPKSVHWLIPYGPQYLKQEIGRNSFRNPGLEVQNISLEKSIPTSWFHMERGRLVFRAEAQDFPNHNNVGLLDVNLLDVGTPASLNVAAARNSSDARNLRFWAKFNF